ncbi:MAG: hypothetical protein VX944_00050 [Myxococcota bacterium]|nr:hypothetical protein [Myxococcota bacterium]
MALPWWLGGLALAVLLVFPGLGFAARFARHGTATVLGLVINAAWISMAINWLNVAVVRQLGVSSDERLVALAVLAALWTVAGAAWARRWPQTAALPAAGRVGLGLVFAAVVGFSGWKSTDLARPLHGHWYLEGADAAEFTGAVPVVEADGIVRIAGSDAGAYRVPVATPSMRLVAAEAARGGLAVAMQGPIGATLTVNEQTATVQRSVTEREDEGAVRRYLDHGVAGVLVSVDLAAGDSVEVQATGDTLFVLPGAESVWAAHADGSLRFVHYYQLLNQVENQVWAEEMMVDRWATLNQPPAWSPQLSLATVLMGNDMPAAGVLFVLVLLLVGASAVRLAVLVAPDAPRLAHAVPAAMMLAHGLLMVEPGSFNFPDSLYAAALLAVAAAVASRSTGWIVAFTIAAGLSRWPGVVVSMMLLLAHGFCMGSMQWRAVARTWAWVGVGAIIAAIGVASGVLNDLLFILYFETFPEHWHGDYRVTKLLPRVPGFYALWTTYTGGGLLVAIAAAFAAAPSERRAVLRWLLTAVLAYSALLATIDHHPTHYFLPLVALTGVMVVVAAHAVRSPLLRTAIPAVTLAAVFAFLLGGDVGLQPIEDMVETLDAALNP